MPKGVPNKRYTGQFKQTVVETMMREKLSYCEAARQFEGNVKSYAQNQFWYLVEIYYRGRLTAPCLLDKRAGRKGSRAAVRRSSCP